MQMWWIGKATLVSYSRTDPENNMDLKNEENRDVICIWELWKVKSKRNEKGLKGAQRS